jgi:adenylate kinase family enzyme
MRQGRLAAAGRTADDHQGRGSHTTSCQDHPDGRLRSAEECRVDRDATGVILVAWCEWWWSDRPGQARRRSPTLLARRLGVAHIELDALWWEPDWTEAGPELFQARLRRVVAADSWVLDGNYFSVGAREMVWPRADTIIWLDQALWVTVARVLRRTIVRALRGTELWSGNRESLSSAFRPDSIVRYAWKEHPKYNLRYQGLADDEEFAHLEWVRLRSPSEVRRWIASLATGRAVQLKAWA